MVILLDDRVRMLVQGITGRAGSSATRYMLEYGTKIMAGVTPGRGGENVWSVPVYNSVEEAIAKHGEFDATVTFVPGLKVKNAVFEAINSGIKFIVMPVERVPLHDSLEIVTYAKENEVKVLGPGSFGIISAGKAVAGWIGGSVELANESFVPGPIGVISRSGGMLTTVCWLLSSYDIGVTTALHIGSEPIVGLSFPEILPLYEEDKDTKAVFMFGEIGTVAEEEAADVMKEGRFTKPLIAYIAGIKLQSGVRYSHASAIISRGKGSTQSKMKALREAGAYVVDNPSEIAPTVKKVLGK